MGRSVPRQAAPKAAVPRPLGLEGGPLGAGGWLLVQICLWFQGWPLATPHQPQTTSELSRTDIQAVVSAPGSAGTLTGDVLP